MKRRLLAAFLSLAMLFSSMPVYAAGPDGEITARKEEEASGTEASETENTISEGAVEESSQNPETDADASSDEKDEANTESAQNPESSTENDEINKESAQNPETSADESSSGSEEELGAATDESEKYESEEESSSGEELAAADEAADVALAMGENPTIALAPRESKWCSFTAGEAGYYQFKFTGTDYVTLGLYNAKDAAATRKYSYNEMILNSDWMAEGTTVYLKVATEYSYPDQSAVINVAKLDSYAASAANGSYVFETPDYTLTLKPEMGCKTILFNTTLDVNPDRITESSNYSLVAYYRQKDSSQSFAINWFYNTESLKVGGGTNSDTKRHVIFGEDRILPETSYDLYFVLTKGKDIQAAFDGGNGAAISLKTLKLPENTPEDAKAAVYSMETTASRVIMDIELFGPTENRCDYAPVDDLEDKQRIMPADVSGSTTEIGMGRRKYTFISRWLISPLESGKAYAFSFNSGYTAEVTLKKCDLSVEYSMGYADDRDRLNVIPTLTAAISGYTGIGDSAKIIYLFTDDLGMKRECSANSVSFTDSNGVKNAQINVRMCNNVPYGGTPVLLKGRSYAVTARITMGAGDDYIILPEQERTITIADDDSVGLPSSAPLDISVSADSDTAGNIKASIINSDESTKIGSLCIGIYYRHAGSKDFESSIWWTKTNGTQPSLPRDIGNDYEFVFMAGGRRIDKTMTAGKADIILEMPKSGEGVKYENNPFDIVRTFKIKDSEGNELSSDGYSLTLRYWDKISYSSLGDRAYIKDSPVNVFDFYPDTDYSLRWELWNPNNKVIYYLYEDFRTPQATINLTPVRTSYGAVNVTVEIKESELANFAKEADRNGKHLYVELCSKKRGEQIYKKAEGGFGFTPDRYSQSGTIRLEPGEVYDIALRKQNSKYIYKTIQFTMPEDTRSIAKINEPTVLGTSATIHVRFSGNDLEQETTVNCSYNKKGEPAGRNPIPKRSSRVTEDIDFKLTGLEPNTAYEYVIELNGKTLAGEFTTAEETISLGDLYAQAATSYSFANIWVNVSNINTAASPNGVYAHVFYREQDGSWIRECTIEKNNVSEFYENVDIYGLKQNTRYEWAVVLSDKAGITSPDGISGNMKQTGSFTLQALECTLAFELDSESITYNSAAYALKASGSLSNINYLTVDLFLSQGEEYKDIRLSRNRDGSFAAKKTLDGLSSNTAYAITKAKITAYESNNSEPAAYRVLDISGVGFTTKALDNPPAGITISAKTLKLNSKYASTTSTAPNGYGSAKLSAALTPVAAPADVFWTSSNESVAAVSQDGIVTAKGAGMAVITVTSKHAAAVKDTCEVAVAAYAAGYKADGSSMPVLSQTCAAVKGDKLKEISLYDWSNPQNPAVIADYTAKSENENIAVFDKESKTLEGKGAGETYISFEADGYRARLKVAVSPAAKGFGVVAVSNSNYPALKNADGSYMLACRPEGSLDTFDGTYKVNLEIAPKGSGSVNESDFTWTSSDPAVAAVSGQGVITPLKAGDVTLAIESKAQSFKEVNKTELKLSVKPLPLMDGSKDTIFALTNPELNIKKLSDVKFPDGWEDGWQWKQPDAPLVTNGADTNASCGFEAVYNKSEKYPMEARLTVKIGKITGVRLAADGMEKEAGLHNNVLETGEDEMTLSVGASVQGYVSPSAYTAKIPDVPGLKITAVDSSTYKIKAESAGSYTLNPSIYAKDGTGTDKLVAKTAYKITAVAQNQAFSVRLSTDTPGVSISDNMVSFAEADKKDFELTAEALDRNNQKIDSAAFEWKITDKTVAMATPAGGSKASIRIKGSGHAVITATAKDSRKACAALRLEVRNHAPRVDANKANVNIAYDYADADGRRLAAAAKGAVEIVPVYGETIPQNGVKLCEEGSKTPSDMLEAVQYNSGYSYIIQPKAAALANNLVKSGTYKCQLLVTTVMSGDAQTPYEYAYDLAIKVTDSAPKVTAKMGAAPNLFYTDAAGTINLSISGKAALAGTVTWEDKDAQNTGNGFSMSSISYKNGKPYISISQQPGLTVNTTTGKLTPETVAQGSLSVKLKAYRKPYVFDNFNIKYSYKKPVLVTKNAETAIIPAIGKRDNYFYVYNNTEKRYVYYNDGSYNSGYYDSISTADADITLDSPDNYYSSCGFSYAGDDPSHTFTLALNSPWWREALTADHTVKAITPRAYLSYNAVTLNTALRSSTYNYVYLNGTSGSNMSEIFTKFDIEGADEKSKELLDKDSLVITASGNLIKAEQNRAEFMNAEKKAIAAGAYSFKITPHCYDNDKKSDMTLNTLLFKVNVINNAVTAKVSPKGSLDLTYGADNLPDDKKNAVVLAEPAFKNLSSGYEVESCRLTGEYSEYFGLERDRSTTIKYGGKWIYSDYIYVKTPGKLKAGQAYKLAIEYALTNGESGAGQEIKVTSNTFAIKPKQTAPKVSIYGNNQTLYAAASLSRSCTLSVPAEYTITSAGGSLDLNKNGNPDISAQGYVSGRYCYLTISIIDKDAAIASAGGKSYSIPIKIELKGRDGISKDVAAAVKVKIKR